MKEKKTNKYSQNPIIFVCHSLGGLVAKKAYILAKQLK
jgi:predicted alpha/beta hydrolase family esterase